MARSGDNDIKLTIEASTHAALLQLRLFQKEMRESMAEVAKSSAMAADGTTAALSRLFC